jgi:hypothetical protein
MATPWAGSNSRASDGEHGGILSWLGALYAECWSVPIRIDVVYGGSHLAAMQVALLLEARVYGRVLLRGGFDGAAGLV